MASLTDLHNLNQNIQNFTLVVNPVWIKALIYNGYVSKNCK